MSKQKGKRGELEFSHFLADAGYPARRGQQFSGTPDSPDVICESLPFHIECKRCEAPSLYPTMEKNQADAGNNPAVKFHRRSGKPWLTILMTGEFLKLIKRTQ